MKKLVGTILAVVTLVALVPQTANAAGTPLPPVQGGGKQAGAGGSGVTNGSTGCSLLSFVSTRCQAARPLPPVSNGGRQALPPVGNRK